MRISCNICKSDQHSVLLDQPKTPIWTNSEIDGQALSFSCKLMQCSVCSHVFQPQTDQLLNALEFIYESEEAQLSTAFGEGNWGLQRANFIINNIELSKNISEYTSALEIGCSNGYFLEYLKDQGLSKLCGVEPSANIPESTECIRYVRGFANSELFLKTKYQIVFAIDVLEHIVDLNDMLEFVKNHLNDTGEFVFSIPNSPAAFEQGDPDIFVHEHFNYFTRNSLSYLLSKYNLKVDSFFHNYDYWLVSASFGVDQNFMSSAVRYEIYQKKLKAKLLEMQSFFEKLTSKKTIIHGISVGFNNVLSWCDLDLGDNFYFVDNDQTKHGKTFYGKKVLSLEEIDLDEFEFLFIVPYKFFEVIKEDYIKKGYGGEIHCINNLI